MALNIIIKSSKSDKHRRIESFSKKLLKDCYKQECNQEEHSGREIGEGSFTKTQLKKIWSNERINHVLSHQLPESEDSGVYEK